MNNDVWYIVPKPKGKSMVTSKWLFKIKHGTDSSIEKYSKIHGPRFLPETERIL